MSYDSTLKYLLETFPQSFVRWLLNTEATPVELLPTELNVEPIRVNGLSINFGSKTCPCKGDFLLNLLG